MGDNDQAAKPQQHGPAIVAVIHTLAHTAQRATRHQCTQHRDGVFLDLLSNDRRHQACRRLGCLDEDIAGEAIGHNHVGDTFGDLFALDIALEVEAWRLLQQFG